MEPGGNDAAPPVTAPLGAGPPEVVAALADHLSEGLLLVRDGQVTASVTPPRGLLGHGDRVGTHTLEHTHPDDLAEALDVAATILDQGPGATATLTVRLRRPDGTWARYAADVVNREDDPTLAGLVIRTRTIHDDGPSLAEVDTGAVLRSLVDAMPTGVLLLERYGHILHANGWAADLLGDHPENLRNQRLEAAAPVTDDDRAGLARAVDEVCRRPAERELGVTTTGPGGDRRLRVRLTSRSGPGVTMVLATIDDVTEQEAREADLRHLASHDALTGLSNRRTTQQLVDGLLTDTRVPDTGPFVVFCDIDGFKAVNDRLGHARGDQVLVALADRLREAVGDLGSVGRLGGDELLVACPGLDDAGADALVARLATVAVDDLGDGQAPVTLSLGWARPEPGDDGAALIARADAAMYRHKRDRRAAAPERTPVTVGE